jgi:hypothetical protein
MAPILVFWSRIISQTRALATDKCKPTVKTKKREKITDNI